MVYFKNAAVAALTALAVFIPGAHSSTYLLSDDRVRSLDATPALGRGYSIMTNRFLSTCLDIDVTSVPSYNYDYSFTDFTQAEDLEIETAGSISNTFGYYYVKEQIENELARQKTFEGDYKYHVVSTMRIERFYSNVKEEVSPLVDNASALLDKQDYVGFFKACGPNYVRSIRRAQEVVVIFSYFSSSLELAQEFATGLKTSNKFGVTADHTQFHKAKFDPITTSLEIKVLGFGLGLDAQGSGTLVAPTLDDYNDVMQFAFRAMTQSAAPGDSKNIGQVFGIEVTPWVDNANFQIISKLHEESIEIPLPRSLLAKAFNIEPGSTAAFDNTDDTRAKFRCKDPSYKIDMYGYCCEREALYVSAEYAYNYDHTTLSESSMICRPVRNLDKAVVKNNMAANAEFVARLDSAVQSRLNQIGTLERCVSAVNVIPGKFDDHYVRPQGSVKFDRESEGKVTLSMLKQAVDPFGDYSLLRYMGNELDEWMDMYYRPCLASLYGKNIGVSSDVEVAYFMAYPWHTHDECTKLTCLSESMRWNRKAGGCEASLLSRSTDTNHEDGEDSFCAYGSTALTCKYDTYALAVYEDKTDSCWGDDTGMLGTRRIDDIMNTFCMPVITAKKITGDKQLALAAAITTNCSNRENNLAIPDTPVEDNGQSTTVLRQLVTTYCADQSGWTTTDGYKDYGAIEDWNTSEITNMSELFKDQGACNPDISGWDVSKVTTFAYMFVGAPKFDQNISGWDVSSGTTFDYMFGFTRSFNQNISGWDVSSGTTFNSMFKSAMAFDQDLCEGDAWDKVNNDNAYSTDDICLGAKCGDCF